jgi:hypothetical protein
MRRASFQLDPKGTIQYLATGKVAAVLNFDVDTAPGQPRPQATTEDGTPLWVIDVLVDGDGDRAQVAGVRVAAPQQPVFEKFKPVHFIGLDVSVYVNKAGQLGLMYEGRLRQVAEQKAA